MTTFKQFINESDNVVTAWDIKQLNPDDAIELLNKHCKDGLRAIGHGSVLYRGFMKIPPEFSQIDTSTAVRTSKDTNNLYQLMMDNSNGLDKFASRATSLICTTVLKYSKSYGRPFVIIPFDGTELTVSNEYDLLNQEVLATSLNDLSTYLGSAFESLGILPDSGNKFTNIARLNSELSKHEAIDIFNAITGELPAFAAVSEKSARGKPLFDAISKNKNSVMTSLSNYFMTENNLKLSLVKFGSVLPETPREVWFTGKALSFSLPLFSEVLNTLIKDDRRVSKKMLDEINAK